MLVSFFLVSAFQNRSPPKPLPRRTSSATTLADGGVHRISPSPIRECVSETNLIASKETPCTWHDLLQEDEQLFRKDPYRQVFAWIGVFLSLIVVQRLWQFCPIFVVAIGFKLEIYMPAWKSFVKNAYLRYGVRRKVSCFRSYVVKWPEIYLTHRQRETRRKTCKKSIFNKKILSNYNCSVNIDLFLNNNLINWLFGEGITMLRLQKSFIPWKHLLIAPKYNDCCIVPDVIN